VLFRLTQLTDRKNSSIPRQITKITNFSIQRDLLWPLLKKIFICCRQCLSKLFWHYNNFLILHSHDNSSLPWTYFPLFLSTAFNLEIKLLTLPLRGSLYESLYSQYFCLHSLIHYRCLHVYNSILVLFGLLDSAQNSTLFSSECKDSRLNSLPHPMFCRLCLWCCASPFDNVVVSKQALRCYLY